MIRLNTIAPLLHTNIGVLWIEAFKENSSALFIRSGNRPRRFFEEVQTYKPILHVDVTALLTIDHLDLWSDLERSGLRLVVPHTAPLTINLLEQTATHHQPARIDTLRRLKDAREAGTLKILDGAQEVPAHGWARIVFASNSHTGSHGATTPAVSLRSLAEHLAAQGAIDASVLAALQRRTSFKAQVGEVDLAHIEHLWFESNTIDELVSASLLGTAVKYFSLHAERGHMDQVEAELAMAASGEEAATQLKALRGRLRDKLLDGSLELLPEPQARDRNALEVVLLELLTVQATEGAWIWIDDRYCSGYTMSNQHPIVTTVEVLDYLHDSKVIGDERFYRLLQELRRVNAAIVPVDTKEVEYWLLQARVEDGELIESPALALLRRSFNQVLVDADRLRLGPPGPDGRLPEFTCLLNSFQLARTLLDKIWSTESPGVDVKLAWSEWVWTALRVQFIPRMPIGSNEQQRVHLWWMALGHLVLIGLSIPFVADHGEAQRAFFDWLQARAVDITERGDRTASEFIGSRIRESVVELIWKPALTSQSVKERELSRRMIGWYVQALPQRLREAALQHQDLQQIIEYRDVVSISIGGYEFEADAFWDALAEYQRGAITGVKTADGVEFEVTGQLPALELRGPATLRISEPMLGLVSHSIEHRQAALAAFAEQIDPGAMAAIAAEPSPAKRMTMLHDARGATISGRSSLLVGHLKRRPLEPDLLRPAAAGRYLSDFGVSLDAAGLDWDSAGDHVLLHTDVIAAFRHVVGVPVTLPRVVSEKLSQLAVDQIRALLVNARRTTTTPLEWIQLLRWSQHRGVMVEEQRELLEYGLRLWKDSADAFITALRWSDRFWKEDKAFRSMPVKLRLACVWSHADHVLRAMLRAGITARDARGAFKHLRFWDARYVLPFDDAYESDVCAPGRMSPEVLLIQGLGTFEMEAEFLPKMQELFFECIVKGSGTEKGLGLHVYEDRRVGSNALGSFMSDEIRPWLTNLYEDNRLGMLAGDARDELRKNCMELATGNIQSGMAWVQLSGLCWHWFPPVDKEALQSCMRQYRFPEGRPTDDDLRSIAGVTMAIPLMNEDLQQQLLQDALHWTSRLGRLHKNRSVTARSSAPASEDAELVTEALLALSRKKDVATTYVALSVAVRESVVRWPALATLWRPFVERIFADTPSEQSQRLWADLISLRALP